MIGNDGEKDSNGNDTKTLYLVPNEADRKTIVENTKSGKTTNRQTVTALELPNADVRQEIGVNAVNRSNGKTTDDKKGKNHEEGGRVYETKTGQIAVPALPGPAAEPGNKSENRATIDTSKAAGSSLLNNVTNMMPLLRSCVQT